MYFIQENFQNLRQMRKWALWIRPLNTTRSVFLKKLKLKSSAISCNDIIACFFNLGKVVESEEMAPKWFKISEMPYAMVQINEIYTTFNFIFMLN